MQKTIIPQAICFLRRGLSSNRLLMPSVAVAKLYSSSSTPYAYVDIKNNDGIATMTMNKPPVNSLSLEFMTEALNVLDNLEADPEIKGLIITSGIPRIFCAGLELAELRNPDPDRLRVFWYTLQEFCMRLYGTPLATAAAINGATPAGGVLVALCTDYRVMAEGKHTMGLNEALLGIPPPFWLKNLMQQTIGFRATDRAVQRGLLFKTTEALTLGLVDEVVPLENVVSTARTEVEKFLKVPEQGRILSKQISRRPFLEDFRDYRKVDLEEFVNVIPSDGVQHILGSYLASLSKKNK